MTRSGRGRRRCGACACLTMLAEKTRGKLDRVEADLLTGAIAHLREQLSN